MRVLLNKTRKVLASRLWAWPLITAVIGVVAAVGLAAVSVPREAALARFLWPGDSSSAASMLSFIASTTLTVLTTTISMTLIVMQVASGNFSHQLLRDFISSRAVRGILAVYIGVFAYVVVLLRSMDADRQLPPQLAMTVAMLLVAVAAGTFIWYLSRVVDMVRVDSIIDGSARRTLHHRDQLDQQDAETSTPRPEVPEDAHRRREPRFGYVQEVDVDHAANWAKRTGATVVIDVRPGDAVIAGETTAFFWGGDEEDLELPEVVYLDLERASGQDFSLGLHQIYDIAVRALSPGVNDPTTALHAVGAGSTVLRQLAVEPLLPLTRHDDSDEGEGRLLVWAAMRPVTEIFSEFVGGIRRYAEAEPYVLIALLRLVDVVEEVCDPDLHDSLQAERDRLVAAARRGVTDEDDLAAVLHAAHAPTSLDRDTNGEE